MDAAERRDEDEPTRGAPEEDKTVVVKRGAAEDDPTVVVDREARSAGSKAAKPKNPASKSPAPKGGEPKSAGSKRGTDDSTVVVDRRKPKKDDDSTVVVTGRPQPRKGAPVAEPESDAGSAEASDTGSEPGRSTSSATGSGSDSATPTGLASPTGSGSGSSGSVGSDAAPVAPGLAKTRPRRRGELRPAPVPLGFGRTSVPAVGPGAILPHEEAVRMVPEASPAPFDLGIGPAPTRTANPAQPSVVGRSRRFARYALLAVAGCVVVSIVGTAALLLTLLR